MSDYLKTHWGSLSDNAIIGILLLVGAAGINWVRKRLEQRRKANAQRVEDLVNAWDEQWTAITSIQSMRDHRAELSDYIAYLRFRALSCEFSGLSCLVVGVGAANLFYQLLIYSRTLRTAQPDFASVARGISLAGFTGCLLALILFALMSVYSSRYKTLASRLWNELAKCAGFISGKGVVKPKSGEV